jgi:5-methyltetrahydropteroyltriglutamate--homocysteine methyltransferase
MFTVSENKPLATTITGSLPKPLWFTENLRGRPFLEAMGSDYQFREQYFDAVMAVISDQIRAGLDIGTDGDLRFDNDIGGRSWFGYLFERMEGLGDIAMRHGGSEWAANTGNDRSTRRVDAPGDILHEVMESRLPPKILGPIGRGSLQYDAVFKAAQRLTKWPVKIGSYRILMNHLTAARTNFDRPLSQSLCRLKNCIVLK